MDFLWFHLLESLARSAQGYRLSLTSERHIRERCYVRIYSFRVGRYVQGCIPERSCTSFLGQRNTLARVNPGSPASPGNLSVRHLFRSHASPTSLLDQRSRQEKSPLRGASCFARKRCAKPKGQRTALRRRNEDEHCEDFGRCSQRREFIHGLNPVLSDPSLDASGRSLQRLWRVEANSV